jgi:DNA-binding transcriptional regulator YhcF (GntR family)
MSNSALNWAWSVGDLRAAEKLVLIRLADRADSKGRCFPGLDSLAADCGVHRTTVVRAVRELEKRDLLSVSRRGGRSKSNRYQLKLLHHATESETEKGSESHEKGSTTHRNSSTTHRNSSTTPPEPSVNPQQNRTHKEPGALCVDDVIRIYNETLPKLPTAKASDFTRNAELLEMLNSMIEQNPKAEQWQSLFRDVRSVPSYMGENDIRWQADLPWLIRNMKDKVLKRINAPLPAAHRPQRLLN